MPYILPIKFSTDKLEKKIELTENNIYLRGYNLVRSELINVDAYYDTGKKVDKKITLYVRDDIGDEIQHIINAPDNQIGIILGNLGKALKRSKKTAAKKK